MMVTLQFGKAKESTCFEVDGYVELNSRSVTQADSNVSGDLMEILNHVRVETNISDHSKKPGNASIGNNSGVLYVKLFNGDASRKSANFRTLLAPAGNGRTWLLQLSRFLLCMNDYVYGYYKMLDEKLVLVDNDWKPLKKVGDPVNADSGSDLDVVYDETAQYMPNRGANDANLYEDEDDDVYDTYDLEDLTKQQLSFYDRMNINLHLI
ncbi:hypothetical protein Tco_1112981 [Tanacetum coccineum]|uniref:Uncharacterized protein n=1 Tax=Tanacetum coccineum TaxID=301880 RepID=A0ABQ5ITW6_9ASTR